MFIVLHLSALQRRPRVLRLLRVQRSHSLALDRQPQPQIPVLADEYAHLPIYNPDELRARSGRAYFLGREHKVITGEKMFETDGSAGRRHFRAAGARGRAAARILAGQESLLARARGRTRRWPTPGAGKPLRMAVTNWFDQTDLNELKVHWSVGGESGDMTRPDCRPARGEAVLKFRARNWRDGDVVKLEVSARDGLVVQESALPVSPQFPGLLPPHRPGPANYRRHNAITVARQGLFTLVFSQADRADHYAELFRGRTSSRAGPIFTSSPRIRANQRLICRRGR